MKSNKKAGQFLTIVLLILILLMPANIALAVTPPTVITNDASNIITSVAVLNGNLSSLGSATVVSVSFESGTILRGPYPNRTKAQTKNAVGAFSSKLIELIPGTSYYFRAKADGGTYGNNYGAEKTLLLLLPSQTPRHDS